MITGFWIHEEKKVGLPGKWDSQRVCIRAMITFLSFFPKKSEEFLQICKGV